LPIGLTRFFKQEAFKNVKTDTWFCIWLLLLCFLCYGVLIPLLGFYWDDIPYLYLYNTYGPTGYPEYVSSDRPFSAWIFMLTTALFDNHAIGYHILAFLLRWISAVLFMKIVDALMPENKTFTYFSASIFLVYPGFLQQPIALIYNHHLSVLCLFLSSVLLMLKNTMREQPNGWLLLFSLVGSLHMFSIENFAALELIRPLLIYAALAQKNLASGRIKKTLALWLPYLLIFLIFIVWRVFIFQFPTYQPGFIEQFKNDPLTAFGLLASRIPADFLTSTIRAWTDSIVFPRISTFGKSATIVFWILTFSTFALTFMFTNHLPALAASSDRHHRALGNIFGLGIILFILAGSINWVMNLPLEIVFAWDRMTLAFIPATSILIALFLISLNRIKMVRNLLFSLLISAAVGSHFQNNMAYKRDWENFKDFLWQLSWRMPTLEKGTTLFGSRIGLIYYSDNSLTPVLNIMYSEKDNPSQDLDYLFYYTEVRLGSGLPALEKNLTISQRHRSFHFLGNTSDMVAIKYDPPACVHVMDRVYSNSITNRNLSDMQVAELQLSNLERIHPSPIHSPPEYLVGSPPEVSWCYLFQKADLARQFGEYKKIIELGDQAIQKGFSPRVGSEWLPFLEGYIRTDRWQEAEWLAREIYSLEGNYGDGLCYTLGRIRGNLSLQGQERIDRIIRDYNCK